MPNSNGESPAEVERREATEAARYRTQVAPRRIRRPKPGPLADDVRACNRWITSVLAASRADAHLDTGEAVRALTEARRVLARVQFAQRQEARQ